MADATVGRVLVSLGVDSKPLQDGAKKAEKALEHLGQTVEGVSKDAAGDFDKVEQAVKDVARTVDAQSDRMAAGFDSVTSAINDLSKSLRKADEGVKAVETANQRATRSLSSMGQSMTSIGTKMSLAVTAPLLATGAAAIKLSNDFEFAMSSIAGLVGVPQQEVERMSGTVRDMAKQFGASAPEAAKALYFVASAGISAANSMNVVEASLKASAIGMGQTQIIADAVSSALNAYGESNLSASEATDLLVASVRRGKMEADTLAAALPRVLPIASAMGVSFQEVGAAFAAMSLNGTDANEAATQIRGILSALLNPTKQAEDQLTALGLSGAMLRKTIREDGLLAGLELLTQAFGNNEEAAGVVFGNIRALTGVMSLFGEATAGTKDIFADLSDNTGEVDKAFQVMAQTGAFKMSQAVANLKDSMIGLGQAIGPVVLPILGTIAKALSTLANTFNALPGPVKGFVLVLGGIAVVGGPLLIMLGSLAKAFTALQTAMATAAGQRLATSLAAYGPALAAVAVGVTAVTALYISFSKRAQEAKDRQEALTAALKSAGDPAATLTDRVSALIDEYERLAGGGSPAAGAVDGVVSAADAFVVAELASRGLSDEIQRLGVPISDVTATVQSGTDWFGKWARTIENSTDAATRNELLMADMVIQLDQLGTTGNYVVDSLNAQYLAGEITGQTYLDIVSALDLLSDAFDDNREKLEEDAKAQLTNTEQAQRYANVLGADVFNALVSSSLAYADSEGILGRYQYALQQVEVALQGVVDGMTPASTVVEELARQAQGTADAIDLLNIAMSNSVGTGEEAEATYRSVADALGVGVQVAANDVALVLLDAQAASYDLVDGFAELADQTNGVELAVRDTFKSMLDLVAQVENTGGSAADVLPTLRLMMDSLYRGADAAGVNRDAITGLINEIGILDGLDPQIQVFLTMNVEEIKAQIATLTRMLGGVTPGGTLEARLLEKLKPLQEALNLISNTPRPRSGGGGGSREKKNPFDWVEDWLADIANFVKDLLDKDFADRLLTMTPDDLADAVSKVLERALELGVDKLDPSGALSGFITKTSESLAKLAGELNNPGGLRDQFQEATNEVKRLEKELKALEDAAEAFIRVEVQGQYNVNELLQQGIDRYNDLKNELTAVQQAYAQFTSVPTELETQLTKLDQLGSALADLRNQLADVNALSAPLSPLDLERKKLDDLRTSLESVTSARLDYAKTTSELVGGFKPTTGRGGTLTQAKAYLAKATQFRDIITSLRDRAFPPSIIRDVVAAGLDGGVSLGRKLLSLSSTDLAELKQVQQQIGQVAAEAGEVAAAVLFDADISNAESAFANQLSLVQAAYASAIAQSEAQFNAQKAIVEGVYQQQIANAQALLDQQKVVVQGLYRDAIIEARANLTEAKKVADGLQASILKLEDAMRELIKQIAEAVKRAGEGKPSTPPPAANPFTPAAPGSEYVESPIGNFLRQPGQDWQLVHRTPFGDYLEPTPGNFVPVDLGSLVARANGGPVTPRNPYLVGEVGPELFVPNTSGTIVPNNALGMGGDNTYNITVNARGDATEVGRQVVRAIQEYERRNGTGWRA